MIYISRQVADGNTTWTINAPIDRVAWSFSELRELLGVKTNAVIKKAVANHRLFPIAGTKGSGMLFHDSEVQRWLRSRV